MTMNAPKMNKRIQWGQLIWSTFHDDDAISGNLMCGYTSARSYRDDSSDRSEVSGASFASNRTYLESVYRYFVYFDRANSLNLIKASSANLMGDPSG